MIFYNIENKRNHLGNFYKKTNRIRKNMKKKVVIGSDHAGFKTKEYIKKALSKDYDFIDVGIFEKNSVDYPDIAEKVGKKVVKDKNLKGILVCGTGTGMVIAANKMKGIRAAVAYDKYSAVMSRRDNNANVLGLRGRNFPAKKAAELAKIWLKTKFKAIPRYKRRINKLAKIWLTQCRSCLKK